MDLAASILVGWISFGRNFLGTITRPYEAYRRIVERGTLWELVPIGVFLAAYFALASIVKTAAFRPFLLTKQFVALGVGASSGFLLAVSVLWIVGRLVGGEGKLGKLGVAWAYTLLPTTVWFLVTSILYVLVPPPRTTSALGVTFSIVFLVFSATIFWWKATLAYLALRFSLKLDLARILVVVFMSAPVLAFWSWLMYRWNIFTVPFL